MKLVDTEFYLPISHLLLEFRNLCEGFILLLFEGLDLLSELFFIHCSKSTKICLILPKKVGLNNVNPKRETNLPRYSFFFTYRDLTNCYYTFS